MEKDRKRLHQVNILKNKLINYEAKLNELINNKKELIDNRDADANINCETIKNLDIEKKALLDENANIKLQMQTVNHNINKLSKPINTINNLVQLIYKKITIKFQKKCKKQNV